MHIHLHPFSTLPPCLEVAQVTVRVRCLFHMESHKRCVAGPQTQPGVSQLTIGLLGCME